MERAHTGVRSRCKTQGLYMAKGCEWRPIGPEPLGGSPENFLKIRPSEMHSEAHFFNSLNQKVMKIK